MANELVLEGGVWKLKEEAPAITNASIDPDYLPSTTRTLASGSVTIPVVLKNTTTNPSVVELSFSGSYLMGVSPDSGSTQQTPTYGIDPDINVPSSGSIRTIYLERDLNIWPSQATETVYFSGSSGLFTSRDIIIEPRVPSLSYFVKTLSEPTIEYNFKDGNFSNSGTNTNYTDGWDLTPVNGMTAVADSEGLEVSGSQGYAYISAANQYAVASNDATRDNDLYIFKSGTPRSITVLFKVEAIDTVVFLINGNPYDVNKSPFYMKKISASSVQTGTPNNSPVELDFYGSHDHTINGVGNSVDPSQSNGCIWLVSHIWDGSGTVTVRWKTLNGNTETSTGHSYGSYSQAAQSASTVAQPWMFGYNVVHTRMKLGYFSIIDYELSESEFTNMTTICGMDV